MHGHAQMDFRNHLLIYSRTRRSRNTSERNKDDKEYYLIIHEETLSDIGNELYTVCTSGRLKGMVSFQQVYYSDRGFRIITEVILQ